MKLVINGEPRNFDDQTATTVQRLLERLEVEAGRGVALAINDEVVPQSRWEDWTIEDGDRVEIIRATQGG